MRAQALVLSFGAALLYSVVSVLQQSAAATVPPGCSLRPGLIIALIQRPRWLLGTLAEVGAYGLQFAALRRGSLILVQTVMVSGLLFVLPLGAAVSHRRLRRSERLGAVGVVLGLSVFLSVGVPTRGLGKASDLAWVAVLGLVWAFVGTLVLVAPSTPGKARAAYLGAACGALFGLNAALAKEVGHLLDHGALHALGGWEPYALAVSAVVGFLLAQSAFQAGPLEASLPLVAILDPLVAALIGVFAFHEGVATQPLAVVAEIGAVVAMVGGVAALTRSPVAHLGPAAAVAP